MNQELKQALKAAHWYYNPNCKCTDLHQSEILVIFCQTISGWNYHERNCQYKWIIPCLNRNMFIDEICCTCNFDPKWLWIKLTALKNLMTNEANQRLIWSWMNCDMDYEMLNNDEINHKDEIRTCGLNGLTHWWNFFQEWIFYTQEKFTIVVQLTMGMKLDYMDESRILDEVDCTQISHLQCETQVFNYTDGNHFPHSFIILLNFVHLLDYICMVRFHTILP